MLELIECCKFGEHEIMFSAYVYLNIRYISLIRMIYY